MKAFQKCYCLGGGRVACHFPLRFFEVRRVQHPSIESSPVGGPTTPRSRRQYHSCSSRRRSPRRSMLRTLSATRTPASLSRPGTRTRHWRSSPRAPAPPHPPADHGASRRRDQMGACVSISWTGCLGWCCWVRAGGQVFEIAYVLLIYCSICSWEAFSKFAFCFVSCYPLFEQILVLSCGLNKRQ